MSESISFTVPLTPPSVNHYKVPVWNMRRFYVTPEATAYMDAIKLFSRGQKVEAKEYAFDVTVYFGKGQKGDGDNLWKVIADGLKKAGVIRSDAAVKDWFLRVRRDWDNPRTEIKVESL
jgi:Holliday junction resolvase RusA-like endonuclease